MEKELGGFFPAAGVPKFLARKNSGYLSKDIVDRVYPGVEYFKLLVNPSEAMLKIVPSTGPGSSVYKKRTGPGAVLRYGKMLKNRNMLDGEYVYLGDYDEKFKYIFQHIDSIS